MWSSNRVAAQRLIITDLEGGWKRDELCNYTLKSIWKISRKKKWKHCMIWSSTAHFVSCNDWRNDKWILLVFSHVLDLFERDCRERGGIARVSWISVNSWVWENNCNLQWKDSQESQATITTYLFTLELAQMSMEMKSLKRVAIIINKHL